VLARALHGRTQRQLDAGAKNSHYAVVRQVSPLQVELSHSRLILTEDDLVITQWVRRYGYDYGLAVGDTVLVSHMPNDDFVVHDVIATAKAEQGIDNAVDQIVASSDPVWAGVAPAGGGAMTVTPDRHIVKKMPVRDVSGAVIGWTPVYTSLP
jgi:hypothetical protein